MPPDLQLTEAPAPLTADGRRIDVTIVRSARRRSLAVHVGALGNVEVRAPMRVPQAEVVRFLERHRGWILRKLADAHANPPWIPVWGEGGHWFWRGETVLLRAGGRRGGQLLDGELRLPVAGGADPDAWRRQVFAWHRRSAMPLLSARAAELFETHCAGHRLAAVEFRWMRATWGTCSGRKPREGARTVNLRFNPWLASLPPELCDSVILHELAHVEHMHHGPLFYGRLAQLNPDWREHDQALREWSRRLLPVAGR